MKNIYIILIISCISCNNNKNDISPIGRNENLYMIDIDKPSADELAYLSDYFKSTETIILETNDDCLIGNINTVRVLDSLIIIMDSEIAKSVFVFDREGHFKHKIGKIGAGPEEYSDITDSSIDFKKKEIYIHDSPSNKINIYNMETGRFVHSVVIKYDNDEARSIQYLDNKIYASATPYYEKEESFLLQEIDLHTGKRIASYLRTSDYNQGWNEWTNYFANNEGFFYPDNKEGAKYVQMFMDTVISIGSHGIRPYFAVKSKNWISKKDVRDLLESKKSNNGLTDDRILFDRNIAYGIHQIYEFGKLIYFRVYKGGTGINVFYNTETNTTEIKDFIIDDLVFRKGGQSVLLPRLSFVDDKGVYSYFQDGMIHSLYEIAQSDGLNPNLDKRDSLVKLAEDANPVIFYYQFRESH